MSESHIVSLPAATKHAKMRIATDGVVYMVWLDWSRWPYRYAVDEDGPTGRRLTRRGSAVAGIHKVRAIHARNRKDPRWLRARDRVVMAGEEVLDFGSRWIARDRETFPHFVDPPTGSSR